LPVLKISRAASSSAGAPAALDGDAVCRQQRDHPRAVMPEGRCRWAPGHHGAGGADEENVGGGELGDMAGTVADDRIVEAEVACLAQRLVEFGYRQEALASVGAIDGSGRRRLDRQARNR
jgi:hypothetical protein